MNLRWFQQKTLIPLLLSAFALAILMACGPFVSNQHPDQLISGGRGISSAEDLSLFMQLRQQNPMFRKAKVTTQADALIVKIRPQSSSPSPTTGPTRLAKDEVIDVYWPLDINNNHIKVFVNNNTAWVTYLSSSGRKYVTLLEDLALPRVNFPGASFLDRLPIPIGGTDLIPSQPISSPNQESLGVQTTRLSTSALSEARLSVSAVNLAPTSIAACDFNPLVGNQSTQKNCYEEIVLSSAFRTFVAQHGYQCAQLASREAFGQGAQKILFHTHSGGQVRRNRRVSSSGKKSVHSVGQALDLFAVSLFFSQGQSRRINLHADETDGSSEQERQNHTFYWSYTNCWRSKIRELSPCNCSDSKAGAMTYQENRAHRNHIHMSLPFCERSQHRVSCV